MKETSSDTRTLVVERELPHPPEKVWRALTQPHLIEEWLAKIDFKPIKGHRFRLQIEPQPKKSFVFGCEVITVEPNRVLSYAWNSSGDEAGHRLETVVTWTLTPTPIGTRLRMEQSGFDPHQPQYYHGARIGWRKLLASLDQVLADSA